MHTLCLVDVSKYQLNDTVGLVCVTKTDRMCSIPGYVIPKTWQTVFATCPALCLTLMGGCKGRRVHAWCCCHWLTISAAFTTKTAMWTAAQTSGNGCHRPFVILQKEYRNWPWTNLNWCF